jgi:hypothetical protein
MGRAAATLPAGCRVTDFISLGVVTKTFPMKTVRAGAVAVVVGN